MKLQRVLLWDFDGTLVHENDSFVESLYTSVLKNKYKVTTEQIRYWLDVTCSWRHPEVIYPKRTGKLWWTDLFERLYPHMQEKGVKSEDSMVICEEFRKRVIEYDYKPFDDAYDTLSKCKEMGYNNCIVSNNHPELENVVQRLGFGCVVQGCYVSANIGYEKPRKEIFDYIKEDNPGSKICFMIGDNPYSDIEGGRLSGLKTILVHKNVWCKSDAMCNNLEDVVKAIGKETI